MGMKQRILIPVLLAVVGFCSPAAAQQPAPSPAPENIRVVQDAESTREQLRAILRTYPEAVGEVLRRDPSLMGRADYMASYPQLVQFLAQHPEIPRNVEYYFEGYGPWQSRNQLDPEYEALGVLLGGMAAFFIVAALIGLLTWLVRAVIQHRRWLRASQVQAVDVVSCRAAVWILARISDESRTNGIQDHITNDAINGFAFANDAVMTPALPETFSVRLLLPPQSGLLFPPIHQSATIGGIVKAHDIEVNMIGHGAVRKNFTLFFARELQE